MALMKKNWAAAVTDCNVLEREIDLAVYERQPDRAREGLHELNKLTTRWVHRILALRKVCMEREYRAVLEDCEYYLDVFKAFAQMGRERLRDVKRLEGVQ